VRHGQQKRRCMAFLCTEKNEAGQITISDRADIHPRDGSAESNAEGLYVTDEGGTHGRRCGSGICSVLCAIASVAFEHLKIGYMQTFRRLHGQHRRLKIRSYNILCAFCSLSWVSCHILHTSPCIQNCPCLHPLRLRVVCPMRSLSDRAEHITISPPRLDYPSHTAQIPSSSRVA